VCRLGQEGLDHGGFGYSFGLTTYIIQRENNGKGEGSDYFTLQTVFRASSLTLERNLVNVEREGPTFQFSSGLRNSTLTHKVYIN